MERSTALGLLTSVPETYKKIATHFSQTRAQIWPELRAFNAYLKPGQTILDLGCGNGRLFPMFKELQLNYTGMDNCQEFLALASENYPEANFIPGDLLKIPCSDSSYDSIYCIAALQHIPSVELRQQALVEMRRVLKPGGYLIMTNWNLWTGKYLKLLLKYSWQKIIGAQKMDFKDILVPWTIPETKETYSRYYHAFTKGELRRLAKNNNFKILSQSKSKNYLTLWQKIINN